MELSVLKKSRLWFINTFAPECLPLPPSPLLPRALVWELVCLVIAKLILTSHEEILAFNLPHDDLWQIRAAARGYWGGAYGPDKLYHLCIYPLFMHVVQLIGLPLRFAFEIFYCGTACLLTVALWRIGTTLPVTMIAALVLIAHPASFQLPNRCGAEILLAPLMFGAIAASLLWWIVRDRRNSWLYAVHSAVWWALAWNVRKESIVLMPVFAVLLLFVILIDGKAGWKKTLRHAIVGIGFILFFCLTLEMAIKTVNWASWGLYATSVHTAPGFRSAIRSLQSIQPDPPLTYIPVPVEVRRRVYAVSPAFAELKPYLEGNVGRGWAVHSKQFTDAKGLIDYSELEISAGFFFWAFYDAVNAAGHGSTPGDADRFLARVGAEINSAIADGRLPGRWVPITMIDPAWINWFPHLPESLRLVGDTFIKPAVPVRPLYDRSTEEKFGADFDRIANRRSYLTSQQCAKAEIFGWAVASNGFVEDIELRSSAGSLLGLASLDIPRHDVDPRRPVGFLLSLLIPSESSWNEAQVAIVLSDGTIVRKPLSSILLAQIVQFPAGKTIVHMGIDDIKRPTFKVNSLWKAQAHWEAWYLTLQSWLLWPGLFAGLAVVIIAIVQPRTIDLAIAILAVAVATRLVFFSIIDASAWQGDQPRYLFAVYPLFSLLLTLLFARVFAYLCRWKNESEIFARYFGLKGGS